MALIIDLVSGVQEIEIAEICEDLRCEAHGIPSGKFIETMGGEDLCDASEANH